MVKSLKRLSVFSRITTMGRALSFRALSSLALSSLALSSLIISSPALSAIIIDISVATNSNTPEAAVANILNDTPDGVCATLNSISGELTSDQNHMLVFCDALSAADESTTGPAYTALSARSFTSITSYSANSFTSFDIGDIAKRLASLRRSANITTSKSAALFNTDSPSTQLFANENNSQARDGGATGGGASADEAGGLNDNRLSGFITGTFDDATQDETSTLAGYESSVNYLFAGLDYRFSDSIFAGVAFKTLSGDISLDQNTGAIDISDNSFSIYGSYYNTQNIYFQSSLTFGQSAYDISRKIDFTLNNVDFNETAVSNPDGNGFSFSLSSGYEHYYIDTGITTVTDISLAYAKNDIDAFTEKAAQGFNLNVNEQSIESLTSKVGIQVSKAVSTSFGVVLPEFSAAWKHEFNTDGEEVGAAFSIDPAKTFSFTTDERESDFFLTSIAASVVLPHGIMGFIQYEKLFGIDNYDKSTLNIGARIEF